MLHATGPCGWSSDSLAVTSRVETKILIVTLPHLTACNRDLPLEKKNTMELLRSFPAQAEWVSPTRFRPEEPSQVILSAGLKFTFFTP